MMQGRAHLLRALSKAKDGVIVLKEYFVGRGFSSDFDIREEYSNSY